MMIAIKPCVLKQYKDIRCSCSYVEVANLQRIMFYDDYHQQSQHAEMRQKLTPNLLLLLLLMAKCTKHSFRFPCFSVQCLDLPSSPSSSMIC